MPNQYTISQIIKEIFKTLKYIKNSNNKITYALSFSCYNDELTDKQYYETN